MFRRCAACNRCSPGSPRAGAGDSKRAWGVPGPALEGTASGPGPFPGRGGAQQPHTWGQARASTGRVPQPLPSPAQSLGFPSPRAISMRRLSHPAAVLCAGNKPAFFLGGRTVLGFLPASFPGALGARGPWLGAPSGSCMTPKRDEKGTGVEGGGLGSPGKQGGEEVTLLPQVEEPGTIPGPSGQDLLSSPAPVCS